MMTGIGQISEALNISKYIDINMQKELFELYGAIAGDGTYYLDRGKYHHMTFFNFDVNLIDRIKNFCEEIAKKKIKVSSRKRKTGIEYSFNIPIIVVKKLMNLDFNKKYVPESIIRSKNSIFLIKGLFETDGTVHGSQIYIYQKNAELLLKDCQRIANSYGLSAHIHNSNRKGEQSLVIENNQRIKQLFGNTIKEIKDFKPKINGYHIVKRLILTFLSKSKLQSTSKIYKFLNLKGVKINRRSLIKHLNELHKVDLINKKVSIVAHDKLGRFEKSECGWNLKINLAKEQIMNYPYGVIKCNN